MYKRQVEVCAVEQVLEDATDGGEIADPAGLEGVFEIGEGPDEGDLQVVCPGGVRQLDRQGGEDLAGGCVILAGDPDGAEELQVEQDVAVFLVVADRDQSRVGRGNVGDVGPCLLYPSRCV